MAEHYPPLRWRAQRVPLGFSIFALNDDGKERVVAQVNYREFDGAGDPIDAEDVETRARLIALLPDLLKAAQKVYDGLNARIDNAVAKELPVPVFDGIAELHTALARARTTGKP